MAKRKNKEPVELPLFDPLPQQQYAIQVELEEPVLRVQDDGRRETVVDELESIPAFTGPPDEHLDIDASFDRPTGSGSRSGRTGKRLGPDLFIEIRNASPATPPERKPTWVDRLFPAGKSRKDYKRSRRGPNK